MNDFLNHNCFRYSLELSVVLVVLNGLLFLTGTAQAVKTSITKSSSDFASLLNKLITVAEGMKTQIVCEVANRLAKQSEELKTLASDTLYSQNLIMDQIKKIDSSVANFSDNLNAAADCCTGQENDIEINHQLLEEISVSVANITGSRFENHSFFTTPANSSSGGKIIAASQDLIVDAARQFFSVCQELISKSSLLSFP